MEQPTDDSWVEQHTVFPETGSNWALVMTSIPRRVHYDLNLKRIKSKLGCVIKKCKTQGIEEKATGRIHENKLYTDEAAIFEDLFPTINQL